MTHTTIAPDSFEALDIFADFFAEVTLNLVGIKDFLKRGDIFGGQVLSA